MARVAVATRTTAVPTAARGPSLYATGAVRPQVRMVEVYNTTVTAAAVGLARATAIGTQGAGLTEICTSDDSTTIVATAFTTHTADATVGACFRQASLGAAIGAGVVWYFEPGELVIDNLTTAGIVIVCPTGTGQQIDFSIVWDE